MFYYNVSHVQRVFTTVVSTIHLKTRNKILQEGIYLILIIILSPSILIVFQHLLIRLLFVKSIFDHNNNGLCDIHNDISPLIAE